MTFDELVAEVKSRDVQAWRSFADRSLKKYDPGYYPAEYLVTFLAGGDLPEQESLVNEVKARDLDSWKAFCDATLKKYDPRHYPEQYLRAFLDGTEVPPIYLVSQDVGFLDKNSLVARTKLAMKQGAPPLPGHRKDPASFSEAELRGYLSGLAGTPPVPGSVQVQPAEAPEAAPAACLWDLADSLISVDRNELISRSKLAVKLGAPPLTGAGKDPSRYSDEDLRSYLWHVSSNETIATQGPPQPSAGDPQGSAVRQQLVQACKAAVKAGAPPLAGRGRDPQRYPDEELVAFLRSVGAPVPEEAEGLFDEQPVEDDSAAVDEVAKEEEPGEPAAAEGLAEAVAPGELYDPDEPPLAEDIDGAYNPDEPPAIQPVAQLAEQAVAGRTPPWRLQAVSRERQRASSWGVTPEASGRRRTLPAGVAFRPTRATQGSLESTAAEWFSAPGHPAAQGEFELWQGLAAEGGHAAVGRSKLEAGHAGRRPLPAVGSGQRWAARQTPGAGRAAAGSFLRLLS